MIKNIILDVGGVLFDDGKQKFTKILNMDIEEVTRICDIAFGKKFKRCMLGEISIIEYIKEFESNTDYELLKYVLDPKYYDVTFPIIKDTVSYIYKLKDKGYKLYLLTNITNGSYDYINKILNINELFDGGVYSFKEHMIKPNKDFYNLLLERYNLNKDECIFFDDVEKNVNVGNELGIKSVKYNSIEDIKIWLNFLNKKEELGMEEKLDVYTRDGKYLGIKSKTECHSENPGFYHKPAWTWVYNSKGEILVQKRAMCKKRFPGLWDMPCAGHVDAGETSKQGAIREAKEEIGVDVSEEEMNFWFEYIEDDCWEIGQVFLFKCDKKTNEFILQEEEVESVKWLNFEEFKDLLYSDKWVPMDREYKDMVVEKFKEILAK